MGCAQVAYDVAAAVKLAIAPASVMPSCRIWPRGDSRYESCIPASTGS